MPHIWNPRESPPSLDRNHHPTGLSLDADRPLALAIWDTNHRLAQSVVDATNTTGTVHSNLLVTTSDDDGEDEARIHQYQLNHYRHDADANPGSHSVYPTMEGISPPVITAAPYFAWRADINDQMVATQNLSAMTVVYDLVDLRKVDLPPGFDAFKLQHWLMEAVEADNLHLEYYLHPLEVGITDRTHPAVVGP